MQLEQQYQDVLSEIQGCDVLVLVIQNYDDHIQVDFGIVEDVVAGIVVNLPEYGLADFDFDTVDSWAELYLGLHC